MTCIVGLIHEGNVYLGGDSAGVGGTTIDVRKAPKVFKNSEFMMGYTDSFRMGQILEHNFTPPVIWPGADLMKYMATSFIEEVRQIFIKCGFNTKSDGQDIGGTFLVGVRDRLFLIERDYQIGELKYSYNACGGGAREAMASFYSTEDIIKNPISRVNMALRAAAEFNNGVTAPFTIINNAPVVSAVEGSIGSIFYGGSTPGIVGV